MGGTSAAATTNRMIVHPVKLLVTTIYQNRGVGLGVLGYIIKT